MGLFDTTLTVTGAGISHMYDQDTKIPDLYVTVMNQIFASAKTLNPKVIGPPLLDIRRNFNVKLLENFETVSMASSISYRVDEDALLLKIQGIDSAATEVVSSTTVFVGDCNECYSNAWMYEEYGLQTETVNDCGFYTWTVGGSQVWINSAEYYYVTATGELTVTVELFECVSSVATYHSVIEFPSNSSKVLEVVYLRGGVDEYTIYVFQDDVTVEYANDNKFLTINYKANFKEVERKYIKQINGIMGIRDDMLSEGYEDAELRDLALTYAAEYTEDEDKWQYQYKDIIEEMLDTNDPAGVGYSITWYVDGFEQEIRYGSTHGAIGDIDLENVDMTFNGTLINRNPDESEDPADYLPVPFAIPLDFFWENRNMREMYHDLRAILLFIAFSQTEVDIPIWQTRGFRLLMWGVALVLAAYGMPQMLVGMFAGEVIASLDISSTAKIILSAIVSLATVNPSQFFSNAWNTITFVTNIANQFLGLYFQKQIGYIQEELLELNDEQKAIEDAIAEMAGQTIYMPLDVIGSIYDDIYDMPFQAYESTYDVQKSIEVNVLKNYEYKPSTF